MWFSSLINADCCLNQFIHFLFCNKKQYPFTNLKKHYQWTGPVRIIQNSFLCCVNITIKLLRQHMWRRYVLLNAWIRRVTVELYHYIEDSIGKLSSKLNVPNWLITGFDGALIGFSLVQSVFMINWIQFIVCMSAEFENAVSCLRNCMCSHKWNRKAV